MDHRLRKNSQFNYVYKKGERVHTEHFTLFAVKSKYENYKIGFPINKKLGKANKRNLLKRRMREITRTSINVLPYFNYVVLAKENATDLSFEQIQKELTFLFKKYESDFAGIAFYRGAKPFLRRERKSACFFLETQHYHRRSVPRGVYGG